jgi:hypothetical protein
MVYLIEDVNILKRICKGAVGIAAGLVGDAPRYHGSTHQFNKVLINS